jgi:CDP-diacylglycerol--glycerol-3-phosphate 3-phosphatidyltransferase
VTSLAKLRFVTFLTFVRFPLVVLFFAGAICYTPGRPEWIFWLSFGFIVLSAVTDLFDGYFARRFNVVTEFGAHADPLMDKFFYLAAFPLLVFVTTRNGHMVHAVVQLVMTLMFLSRDQWVTFLRSIGAMYQVSGGAKWAGKLRTAVNLPLACVIYFYEASPVPLFSATVVYACEAFAIAVNFFSLYTYTRDYWPYIKQSARLEPPPGTGP